MSNSSGVPNSGFRLFGRIRIVLLKLFGRIRIRIALAAEHFDAPPAVLIFTTPLNSCGCLYDRCLLSVLPSHDPLPFIRLIASQNQVVRARTSAGTDRVKLAVDVSSSDYSYSF